MQKRWKVSRMPILWFWERHYSVLSREQKWHRLLLLLLSTKLLLKGVFKLQQKTSTYSLNILHYLMEQNHTYKSHMNKENLSLGRVESDLWSSSPLWTITSDHFYAPISQEFYGSPAHFCTSYSSPPSLLSKGSCLFRFTPSTGNPLWMTHCKHFLLNNANRPAG